MLLHNNFDVGPDGTIITTGLSAGASGEDTAFDSVSSAGTGVVCVYRTASNRPTALGFVGEFSTGNGNGANTPSCVWSTTLGQPTDIWIRFYVKFSAAPLSGFEHPIFLVQKGATKCVSFGISGANNLFFCCKEYFNNAFTELNQYSIQVGDWIRVEADAHCTQPGTIFEQWTLNASIYVGAQVDTDSQTDHQGVGASPLSIMSFMDNVSIGYPVAHKNYPAMQIGGLVVSDSGAIGAAPFVQQAIPAGPNYSF